MDNKTAEVHLLPNWAVGKDPGYLSYIPGSVTDLLYDITSPLC